MRLEELSLVSHPDYIPLGNISADVSVLAVWLGWWASAAENNPNEGVGKWLGVYVVLGVIAMGGATFGAW